MIKSLLKSSKSIARPSTKSLGDSKFQLDSFLHFLEKGAICHPQTFWERTTYILLCYSNQILLIVAYSPIQKVYRLFILLGNILQRKTNPRTSRHRGGRRLNDFYIQKRVFADLTFSVMVVTRKGPYSNYKKKSKKNGSFTIAY